MSAPRLHHIADLTPPCPARAWHTAPHPTLPLVATSSADRAVRVYSLRNFRQHSIVEGGHKRSVRASAWRPSHGSSSGSVAAVLATGSFDASVGIWRFEGRGAGARDSDGDGDGDVEEGEEDWHL